MSLWGALYDATVAGLADDGTIVESAFGLREPMKQPKTAAGVRARISWVPGDDIGAGTAGKQVPTVDTTTTADLVPARPLATFEELFTIYIEAQDSSSKTARVNDRASYEAVHSLLEAFWRNLHRAAYTSPDARVGGRWRLQNSKWLTDKRVQVQGACLVLVIALPVQLPDSPVTILTETGDGSNAEAELTGHLTSTTAAPDAVSTDPETQRTDDP